MVVLYNLIPSIEDFKNSSKVVDKMVVFRLQEHKVITIEKDLMSD